MSAVWKSSQRGWAAASGRERPVSYRMLGTLGLRLLLTQSGNPSSYKAVIEANESGRPAVEKLEPRAFSPRISDSGCSRESSQRRSLYTPCACVTGDSAILISAADRGPIER